MRFQWTIPNFLTVFRVILVPFMLWLIIVDSLWSLFLALVLYGISAITDALDGMIARKFNQTSEFGAYFDPLADKILVWSIFTVLCFNPNLIIPIWFVSFIYIRDIFVTVLRTYSKKQNIRFETSFLAKSKTAFQMIALAMIMGYMFATRMIAENTPALSQDYFGIWSRTIGDIGSLIVYLPLGLTVVTVIFTLLTGFDYYREYKKAKGNQNA